MSTTARAPYDGNTATLPGHDTENGRNHGSDKETTDRWLLVAVVDGKITTAIDARFYMGRSKSASVVYCSVWMHSRDRSRFLAGHGSAGGCGYHKTSAALDSALESAGVKLEKRIDGCGESAMRAALEALAIALGYGDCIREVLS